jgi:hypothetical protein
MKHAPFASILAASLAGAISLAAAAATAPKTTAPTTPQPTVVAPPTGTTPAAPAAVVKPPPSGTVALKDVPDPKNTLVRAKIIDLKGNSIGSVGDIMLDATGKPSSLKVDVGGFLGVGAKVVGLNADVVKWDPEA